MGSLLDESIKPGDPIMADFFEAMRAAVVKLMKRGDLQVTEPLNFHQNDYGNYLSADIQMPRWGKVTTQITAASGNTLGTGKVSLMYANGNTLTEFSPAWNVDVRNDILQVIAVNNIVKVVVMDDGQWALFTARCP